MVVVLLACCITMWVGCGDGGPDMVPVSGKVTFDGGECPNYGYVLFNPVEVPEGAPHRPGTGRFDKDGQFTVTSIHDGDGLYVGRYRVSVQCNRGLPPPIPGGMELVTYVQPGYEPDNLVVELGSEPIEVDYDVPLKK